MNNTEKERLNTISAFLDLKNKNIPIDVLEDVYKNKINNDILNYMINLPKKNITNFENIINKIKNNDYNFSNSDKEIYKLIKNSILDNTKSIYDIQREKIIADFEQKKYNYEDLNPSNKFIYENQEQSAIEIIQNLKEGKKAVSLIALPQVGKTGTFIYFIYLALTDNNNDFIFLTENTYILTGMNDKSWINQTKNDLFDALKNNIYHLGTIKKLKSELSNKINSRILIVLDESQIATSEDQKISHLFKEIDNDNRNDNKIYYLVVSATPSSPLLDFAKWGDKHSKVFLNPPPSYIGFKTFIAEKRIENSQPISEKYLQKINNLIKSRYNIPKYHIFRLSQKNREIILNWIKNNNYKKINIDSDNSFLQIDNIFNRNPENHTIILIKNFWRAGKRMNDKHIGIVYEHNKNVDFNITAQGLIARFCGNDKQKNNPQTPYFLCNVDTIKKYIDFIEFECDFAKADYISKNLNIVENEKIKHIPSFVNGILKTNDEDGTIKKEDYCSIPIMYKLTNQIYEEINECDNKINFIGNIIKKLDNNKYEEILKGKYNCIKCTIPEKNDSYKRHISDTKKIMENNKYIRPTDLPKDDDYNNCYVVYIDNRSNPKKLYLWLYHGKKKRELHRKYNLKCKTLNVINV
jgi:hypothetical protein